MTVFTPLTMHGKVINNTDYTGMYLSATANALVEPSGPPGGFIIKMEPYSGATLKFSNQWFTLCMWELATTGKIFGIPQPYNREGFGRDMVSNVTCHVSGDPNGDNFVIIIDKLKN
jgi:hypothetical protein